jgi:putative restriction endonuclease
MATLSSRKLMSLLGAALPSAVFEDSDTAPKPVRFRVEGLGLLQVYLWTTTPDRSVQGRPAGEHKSQIIIPGTERGSKQHFELDAAPTFLLGYSPLYGVFVAWQAALHQDAGYSKNLQVGAEMLEEASREGWAVDEPRRTNAGPEVRVAAHPSHLLRLLTVSADADNRKLAGEARAAFLAANSPMFDALDIGAALATGKPVTLDDVERERIAATGTRLRREAGFSKLVLTEFGYQCAVCELQLSIVDGAHIIPVHHPKGSDEVWNGLALCKNHHRLFDKRIMLVDQDAIVRADDETLRVLEELGQLGGLENTIGVYRGKLLKRLPAYFGTDTLRTSQIKEALRYNYALGPAL